jgi:hypothetical protein
MWGQIRDNLFATQAQKLEDMDEVDYLPDISKMPWLS